MEKYIGDLELDNGDVIAVVKKNGYLVAGSVTNSGMFEDYKMKYDEDVSLDENLQNFVEYIDNHTKYDSKRLPKHTHKAHEAIERGCIKGSKRDARRPRSKGEYCVKSSALRSIHSRDSLKRKRHTRDSLRKTYRIKSTRRR